MGGANRTQDSMTKKRNDSPHSSQSCSLLDNTHQNDGRKQNSHCTWDNKCQSNKDRGGLKSVRGWRGGRVHPSHVALPLHAVSTSFTALGTDHSRVGRRGVHHLVPREVILLRK